jgi:CelD/BcsL family acetyltransferase involved in cellulose biosynthesis
LHRRALEVCPHIKISGDFAAYLQTLPTKHSGNFRRQLRKLKESHAVTLDIAIAPAQAEKDFAVLCELHRQRWAGRNEASAFDNERSQLFHQRVVQAAAADGVVRIFTLKCDGQSVAALYCFLYDNRLTYYQSGIDVGYEKKSVGVTLLGMVLQHCFEQGYREFDFLRGEEEYKFRWTKTTRRTVAGEIAVSRRARIYLQSFQALRRWRNRLINAQDRVTAQKENA